ncbi:hypothetical protein GKC34_15340 (plasmid) [Lactobacillus salivarius]|uniref:Uncharacterized protein n=1 Tax=Ligilactobacillus salivarius TaxID=1624 RepID=A0A6A8LUT1_9LACO|nr:hypothetical protein [Ligilactobacillus salivarius]
MHTHRILLKYIVGATLVSTPLVFSQINEVHAANFDYEIIQATPETSFKMAVMGEYFPTDAETVLAYINKERLEATEKGYFGYKREQYRPLRWNQQLEQLARDRAIEASLYSIHSRTSGENPSTNTFQENLAWFNTNTMDNIRLLMSEKAYYLKNRNTLYKDMLHVAAKDMEAIGHYYAFVDPSMKYVAAATFQMDPHYGITPNIMVNPDNPTEDLTTKKNYGVTAVTFAKNNHYGTDETPLAPLPKKDALYDVLISSASFLELRGLEVWWPDESLQTGNAYQIRAKATTYYNDHGRISVGNAPIIEGNWQSSDPSVLSVDRNGVIKVHNNGTATITFSVKYATKMTASRTFQVHGGKVAEVTTVPIEPTGAGVKYGDAVTRAVDLAPTQLLKRTSEEAIYVMVRLSKKLKQLPMLVNYTVNKIPLADDFKMEIQRRQQDIADMERIYYFAEYMNQALAGIANKDSLSAEEKQDLQKAVVKVFYDKVRDKTNQDIDSLTEEVRQIVKQAEVKNYQNIEKKELLKQRDALLALLPTKDGLTDEEKQDFNKRVLQAETLAELTQIKDEMQKTIREKTNQGSSEGTTSAGSETTQETGSPVTDNQSGEATSQTGSGTTQGAGNTETEGTSEQGGAGTSSAGSETTQETGSPVTDNQSGEATSQTGSGTTQGAGNTETEGTSEQGGAGTSSAGSETTQGTGSPVTDNQSGEATSQTGSGTTQKVPTKFAVNNDGRVPQDNTVPTQQLNVELNTHKNKKNFKASKASNKKNVTDKTRNIQSRSLLLLISGFLVTAITGTLFIIGKKFKK